MQDQDKETPTRDDGGNCSKLIPAAGALIIDRPQTPGRHGFTLLVPYETTWTVRDFGSAFQFDFRPRTPVEMAELWKTKGRL